MSKLSEENLIPFKKFVFLILKNWQWFILSISLSLMYPRLLTDIQQIFFQILLR